MVKLSPFDEDNQIDETSEVNMMNVLIFIGMLFSLFLGGLCLMERSSLMDDESSVFLFTLFYMSVELASAVLSLFILLCLVVSSFFARRDIAWTQLCSLAMICTYSLSYLAHIAAILVGPIIFLHNREAPLIFKTFILYHIFFGTFTLGRVVYLMCNRQQRSHFMPEADDIAKANKQAEEELKSAKGLHLEVPAQPYLVDTPAAPLDLGKN